MYSRPSSPAATSSRLFTPAFPRLTSFTVPLSKFNPDHALEVFVRKNNLSNSSAKLSVKHGPSEVRASRPAGTTQDHTGRADRSAAATLTATSYLCNNILLSMHCSTGRHGRKGIPSRAYFRSAATGTNSTRSTYDLSKVNWLQMLLSLFTIFMTYCFIFDIRFIPFSFIQNTNGMDLQLRRVFAAFKPSHSEWILARTLCDLLRLSHLRSRRFSGGGRK